MTVATLFLGSSLGTILARLLVKATNLQLINPTIPGVSSNLVIYKTFDFVEFIFAIIATLGLFFVNYVIERRYLKNAKDNNITKTPKIFFLILSSVIFVQTHFVTSSGKIVLVLIGVIELQYLLLNKYPFRKFPKNDIILLITNGALTGYWGLLIANTFTTSIAIPVSIFLFCVFWYVLLGQRYKNILLSPFHLVLPLGLFFPTNTGFLFILGGVSVFLILLFKDKFSKLSHTRQKRTDNILSFLQYVGYGKINFNFVYSFLYPVLIIVVIYYNPLYYAGNLDSVEEGFWLAWLERMKNGQHIYRDFAAYHPPFLAWGMYAFVTITDFTIKNVRLFLHICQIISAIIFYFFTKNLVSKKVSILATFLIFLSATYTPVRNNVEIRTTIGLLAILFWFYYLQYKHTGLLIFSGLISSISLFTSTEVGISVTLAIALSILITGSNKPKSIVIYLFGLFLGVTPVVIYLAINSSLTQYISYIFFYSSTLAQGYFNTAVERAISTAFLRWHLVWQYFSSTAWLTEFTRMVFLTTFIVVAKKVFDKSKSRRNIILTTLTNKEVLAFTVAVFGIILFRSVLGRSDYYHVLFVLIPALPLCYFLLEKYDNKAVFSTVTAFLLFVVFAKPVNETYLSHVLFKFTTYATIVDEYKSYDIPNSQILVGTEVDVDKIKEVVDYINENTHSRDTIFVFPWNPELYFLSDIKNATSFDTPHAFWSDHFQNIMVSELQQNTPKLIILNKTSIFGNLGPNSLPLVNGFINDNYKVSKTFYPYDILIPVN
ncbi:glycosyltransferase family 39 protein [Candidatus Woesebacteria bacterium]|nr:MAG: glycosyltransferase family 39 protein [Candidatus Woesebacteria bacterium]